MPPASFTPGEDGKFHCTEPECTASYDLPQHLGLHRFHTHGIKGMRAKPCNKKIGRPRKVPDNWTADDICSTVLAEIAPNGSIPISAISAYQRWVAATQEFMVILLG